MWTIKSVIKRNEYEIKQNNSNTIYIMKNNKLIATYQARSQISYNEMEKLLSFTILKNSINQILKKVHYEE